MRFLLVMWRGWHTFTEGVQFRGKPNRQSGRSSKPRTHDFRAEGPWNFFGDTFVASALYPSPYPGPHPGPYPSPYDISKQILETNTYFSSNPAQPGEAWGDMRIEGFCFLNLFMACWLQMETYGNLFMAWWLQMDRNQVHQICNANQDCKSWPKK